MKTVQELVDFCKAHNNLGGTERTIQVYGLGMEQMVKMLRENEEISYITASTSVQRSNSSLLWCASVAVTNDRLLIGGQLKGWVKLDYTASGYDIMNISSINVSKDMLGTASIKIETLAHDDIVIMAGNREIATNISRELSNAIDAVKAAKAGGNAATVIQQASAADEIKKFKELLDMGVISQEEFDAKKKQLLGL